MKKATKIIIISIITLIILLITAFILFCIVRYPVNPESIKSADCLFDGEEIYLMNITFYENKQPKLHPNLSSNRYENDILYITLWQGGLFTTHTFDGFHVMEKDYPDLKKIVIEGGIFTRKEKVLWEKQDN